MNEKLLALRLSEATKSTDDEKRYISEYILKNISGAYNIKKRNIVSLQDYFTITVIGMCKAKINHGLQVGDDVTEDELRYAEYRRAVAERRDVYNVFGTYDENKDKVYVDDTAYIDVFGYGEIYDELCDYDNSHSTELTYKIKYKDIKDKVVSVLPNVSDELLRRAVLECTYGNHNSIIKEQKESEETEVVCFSEHMVYYDLH